MGGTWAIMALFYTKMAAHPRGVLKYIPILQLVSVSYSLPLAVRPGDHTGLVSYYVN